MSGSNTPQSSDPSTRREPRPESNSDLAKEFRATRSMYKTLASRFHANPSFLPRTLWRKASAVRENPPAVLYQSGHNRFGFKRHVKRMRCLWCRDNFFRFADMSELLQHLRTCHGRFRYRIGNQITEQIAGKNRTVEVIYMKLLEGDEGIRATAVDRFDEPAEDAVYINPKRSPTKSSAEVRTGEKRSAEVMAHAVDEPPAKRHRPVRSCTAAMREDAKGEEVDSGGELRGRGNGKGNGDLKVEVKLEGKGEGKDGKKGKGVKTKVAAPKLAYESVAQAVKENRLFHSVLQTKVRVEEVERGEDSDAEDELGYEREWRLALANHEVDDFTDTLPVEKLFFNLWNQFLTMEFYAYSDRTVAPACMKFAKKYRRIIQELNMELTFMRHLAELRRMGLMGASAVFETMLVLKDRDKKAKNEEEEDARFYFVDDLKRRAAISEANKDKKRDAGRPVG